MQEDKENMRSESRDQAIVHEMSPKKKRGETNLVISRNKNKLKVKKVTSPQ
jgi:hypothetical protein